MSIAPQSGIEERDDRQRLKPSKHHCGREHQLGPGPKLQQADRVFGRDLHQRLGAVLVVKREAFVQALEQQKQTVRGVDKGYVDFDKCLPFFNQTNGCAICIAVCPWSRPGVGLNLAAKLARRRERKELEGFDDT